MKWRLNVVLFALTVVSVFSTQLLGEEHPLSRESLLHGVQFSGALLGILVAHEFGHFIAARLHKVDASLPFFIPIPYLSPFGTMGAIIRMRSRIPTRRALLDIGASGPLAGMALAIPLYAWGVAHSKIIPLESGGIELGDVAAHEAARSRLRGAGSSRARHPVAPGRVRRVGRHVRHDDQPAAREPARRRPRRLRALRTEAGHVRASRPPRRARVLLREPRLLRVSRRARGLRARRGSAITSQNSIVLAHLVRGARDPRHARVTRKPRRKKEPSDDLGIRNRAVAIALAHRARGAGRRTSTRRSSGSRGPSSSASRSRWSARAASCGRTSLLDHPPTGAAPLDFKRKAIAVFTLAMFAALFMPTPFEI